MSASDKEDKLIISRFELESSVAHRTICLHPQISASFSSSIRTGPSQQERFVYIDTHRTESYSFSLPTQHNSYYSLKPAWVPQTYVHCDASKPKALVSCAVERIAQLSDCGFGNTCNIYSFINIII